MIEDMKNLKLQSIFVAAIFAACTPAAYCQPSVRIAGDSISLGYTAVVADDLKGKFTVAHQCGNGTTGHCNNGHTEVIRRTVHNYFKTGDVDVMVMNAGIHDMSVRPKALHDGLPCIQKPRVVPLPKYESNLNAIFDYLAKHSKVVIWIDTTTLPPNTCASKSLDTYNQVAEHVARSHHFYILRLDSVGHDAEGIHFTENGYTALGKQVAGCIVTAWSGLSTEKCQRT